VQASGDIIAAGTAGKPQIGNLSVMALARYSATGQLDTTFGSGGRATTSFSSSPAAIVAMVIQSDGKIVVVGSGKTAFTVARYLGQ
jgi:hypothetical protein